MIFAAVTFFEHPDVVSAADSVVSPLLRWQMGAIAFRRDRSIGMRHRYGQVASLGNKNKLFEPRRQTLPESPLPSRWAVECKSMRIPWHIYLYFRDPPKVVNMYQCGANFRLALSSSYVTAIRMHIKYNVLSVKVSYFSPHFHNIMIIVGNRVCVCVARNQATNQALSIFVSSSFGLLSVVSLVCRQ